MNPSKSLMREIPEHDRPRERLARLGPKSLTDPELLAVLLRTGRKGVSVVSLAEGLIRRFGSLEAIGRQSVAQLAEVKGMGTAKASLLLAAFDLHRRISAQQMKEAPLDTPEQIHRFMCEQVRFLDVEVLYGLALDSKLRLIRQYEISSGLLNQTLAHPREVYREAISASAAFLALVHNHPSGDPKPSPDDIRTTREIARAGEVVGIQLLDHVIIGKPSAGNPNGYVSFKQNGLLGSPGAR